LKPVYDLRIGSISLLTKQWGLASSDSVTMAWELPGNHRGTGPIALRSYNWMPIEGLKNATGKSVDVKTDYKGWPGWLWVTAQN